MLLELVTWVIYHCTISGFYMHTLLKTLLSHEVTWTCIVSMLDFEIVNAGKDLCVQVIIR